MKDGTITSGLAAFDQALAQLGGLGGRPVCVNTLNVAGAEPAAYTRGQVTIAMGTAHGQLDWVTDTSPLGQLVVATWAALSGLGAGPFTRDQVAGALNDAANEQDDAVDYENSDTVFAQDARNLFVNTVLYQLDHPGAELAEAIVAGYGTPPAEGGVQLYADDLGDADAAWDAKADAVRGTPEYNAAVVAKVLGWVS